MIQPPAYTPKGAIPKEGAGGAAKPEVKKEAVNDKPLAMITSRAAGAAVPFRQAKIDSAKALWQFDVGSTSAREEQRHVDHAHDLENAFYRK